jgi:ribose 5-phosphate isomerase B
MKIALGCDHAGFLLKAVILQYLTSRKIDVLDLGTDSPDSVDYPDYAEKVAGAVTEGTVDYGILICGTGLGMAMSANKIPGIRAVTVSEPYSAEMARAHNNANVLAMGSRVIGPDMAVRITDVFLSTPFDEGRHCGRIQKISRIENGSRTGEEV